MDDRHEKAQRFFTNLRIKSKVNHLDKTFKIEHEGKVYKIRKGTWGGFKLPYALQRELFGHVPFGRKAVVYERGEYVTLEVVAYGRDYSETFYSVSSVYK